MVWYSILYIMLYLLQYIAHRDKHHPDPHSHRYPHVHSPHPNVGSCARRHEPAQQEVPHWVA